MIRLLVFSGALLAMVSAASAQPGREGELLHKDVRRGSITNLLERESALRSNIRVGAAAGWLTSEDAAALAADVDALDRDVRAIAMGNVAYTPQSRIDALYDRVREMEAFVARQRPRQPRRRR